MPDNGRRQRIFSDMVTARVSSKHLPGRHHTRGTLPCLLKHPNLLAWALRRACLFPSDLTEQQWGGSTLKHSATAPLVTSNISGYHGRKRLCAVDFWDPFCSFLARTDDLQKYCAALKIPMAMTCIVGEPTARYTGDLHMAAMSRHVQ